MITLKCKMCGGELEISEETSVCECEYCGSKQTIPTIDDEKIIKLYDRANRLRMANEFDRAFGVYESIVQENDAEAEAYWGLLLSKYGIEYVDDPASGDKIPTCHRVSFDSILEDSDFEMVMENADALSRNVYRNQAKQIEEIRKGIIDVSGKEEPYDIFICYKETADDGDRTIDSVMAQDVYEVLTDKGYRVFFSRISLEDKLGTEYEPYIFAALNSAKVMLAFGTSYDYYNAVWVKNEWSRYIKLMAKDKEKHLIPCYKDIDAYDIPKEFKHLQAQDMGKVGAIQDLLRGIGKIIEPASKASKNNVSEVDINAAIASAMAVNSGSNMAALLERGFMTLEDGDFTKADELFEDVLNQNPKCAEAYMGKLMAYHKVENTKKFAKKIFETCFSEEKEKKIEINYDIQDLLENHYILSNEISEVTMSLIRKAFNVSIETNIDCLNQYNEANDYIEKYCSIVNHSNGSSKQDDKYYKRYLQYATEESKKRFNIHKYFPDMVVTAKTVENNKVVQICNKYSRDNVVKIIESANEKAKPIIDYAFEFYESEYQSEFTEWQKECEEITSNWKQKRQQIQAEWEAECDAIKQKYEQRKKEVDENNQKVKQLYQQGLSQYESELVNIDNQLRSLYEDLTGLKGLFKGKLREKVQNNITILESKKSNLKKPILTDYGITMKEPRMVLPEQPSDNDGPVLPEEPMKEELNLENVIIEDYLSADDILHDEFYKEGIANYIANGRRIVQLGSYKGSPISWIMLEKKDGKALLLSEHVLDKIPYNNRQHKAVTWEQCTLRSWLNNDFLNEALGLEKNRICMTKVTEDANPASDINSENDTYDKIFLLSINEFKKYFPKEEEGKCYPTEYVKAKKLTVDDDKCSGVYFSACSWWLRSTGCNAAVVTYWGKEYQEDPWQVCAVRPALWIDLET